MTTSDRNHEFTSSVLYHGTSSLLKPGDFLDPKPIIPSEPRSPKYVYSTPDVEVAHEYASGDNNKIGYVYQVEPESNDRIFTKPKNPKGIGNKHIKSENKVKVIKKIRTVLPIVSK